MEQMYDKIESAYTTKFQDLTVNKKSKAAACEYYGMLWTSIKHVENGNFLTIGNLLELHGHTAVSLTYQPQQEVNEQLQSVLSVMQPVWS